MAYSIERSKAPLVSADPNKHVVEEGFPLYLSKNTNRCKIEKKDPLFFVFIDSLSFISSFTVFPRGASNRKNKRFQTYSS